MNLSRTLSYFYFMPHFVDLSRTLSHLVALLFKSTRGFSALAVLYGERSHAKKELESRGFVKSISCRGASP